MKALLLITLFFVIALPPAPLLRLTFGLVQAAQKDDQPAEQILAQGLQKLVGRERLQAVHSITIKAKGTENRNVATATERARSFTKTFDRIDKIFGRMNKMTSIHI